MIEGIGTLREQMMRCYMLGYLIQRHNDCMIVEKYPDYDTYKELKKDKTVEILHRAGFPRSISKIIVMLVPPMEKTISVFICVGLFIIFSFRWLCTKKTRYHNNKFTLKLNLQEKRLVDLLGSAGYGPHNVLAIDVPQTVTKYEIFKVVSLFSGITYQQLLQSFVYSLRTCFFEIKKYHKDDLLFRAYSSFPFYLCFYFIDNLDNSNELVFFNHYERWTYLFGNSHLKRIYVQHGIMPKDHIKRINCDIAYYINKEQQEILEYTIFSNKPEARFRKLFDYSGDDKLKHNGRQDVLVICVALFWDSHVEILRRLYDKNVNIYLKPHPADNIDTYEKLKDEYPEIVILSKFDYPKVDYVISYDSTLADEYEMHDLPVIRYKDDDFALKMEGIVAKSKGL